MNYNIERLIQALESQAKWNFDEYYFDRTTGDVLSGDLLARNEPSKLLQVESDTVRYKRIKPLEPHDIAALLDEFLAKVSDPKIEEILDSSYESGRTPLLSFINHIVELPEFDRQWREFHFQYMTAVAEEWFNNHGKS